MGFVCHKGNSLMINIENLIQYLPTDGVAILYCKDGEIMSVESLRKDQFVTTILAVIETLEIAGYVITIPNV